MQNMWHVVCLQKSGMFRYIWGFIISTIYLPKNSRASIWYLEGGCLLNIVPLWKCWQFLHFYDTPPAFTLRFLEVIILNEFYDVKNSWESPFWWYQMMEKPAHHPNVPKAKVVPIIKHHFSYVSLGELNMQQFTMCSLIKKYSGVFIINLHKEHQKLSPSLWCALHKKSSVNFHALEKFFHSFYGFH